MAPEGPSPLRTRYAYKFGASLLTTACRGAVYAVVPRTLGPEAFGDFNFLTAFFTRIIDFFDTGTSTAFYAKLSQRPRETGLVSFYLVFCGLVSAVVFLFIAAAVATRADKAIWPHESTRYVLLAAILSILLWVSQVVDKLGDAYGLTVPCEKARVIQQFLATAAIVAVFLLGLLDLRNYFLCRYLNCVLVAGAILWICRRNGFLAAGGWRISAGQCAAYAGEFFRYVHPLFVFAVVDMLLGILDRWLLQFYGGNAQQGFFGFSYHVGGLCLLCASVMSPLLMREFSVAYHQNDRALMASLFRKYIPVLYSVTAYFSCFIAVEADTVSRLFGGSGYQGASAAVALMALYPIHQTYGQLSGSVFYATGQTKLYRNIGLALSASGLPLSFFLLAPKTYGGLGAGASGLAVKMLLLQFVGVNVQLFFNSRFLGLRFSRYLAHQLANLIVLLPLAYAAGVFSERWCGLQGRMIASFLSAGLAYTGLVAAVVSCWPALFGLKREQLLRWYEAAKCYKFPNYDRG